MSINRVCIGFLTVIFLASLIGSPAKPVEMQANSQSFLMAGRNVNMVAGQVLPGGDSWLQRLCFAKHADNLFGCESYPAHIFLLVSSEIVHQPLARYEGGRSRKELEMDNSTKLQMLPLTALVMCM